MIPHPCEEGDQFKALWDAHNEAEAIARQHGESLARVGVTLEAISVSLARIEESERQTRELLQRWTGMGMSVVFLGSVGWAAITFFGQWVKR